MTGIPQTLESPTVNHAGPVRAASRLDSIRQAWTPPPDGFAKSLETLTAADLAFIGQAPVSTAAIRPPVNPSAIPSIPSDLVQPRQGDAPAMPLGKPRLRRRRPSPGIGNAQPPVHARNAAAGATAMKESSEAALPASMPLNEPETCDASANSGSDPAGIGVGRQPYAPGIPGDTEVNAGGSGDTGVPDAFSRNMRRRTRTAVTREWPPVGAKLSADYFGQTYRAEIVPAHKRLQSGKQIRLLDGPSAGRRLDTLSRAMLTATARQRREQRLGRKGVSNGWAFWREEPRSGQPGIGDPSP